MAEYHKSTNLVDHKITVWKYLDQPNGHIRVNKIRVIGAKIVKIELTCMTYIASISRKSPYDFSHTYALISYYIYTL